MQDRSPPPNHCTVSGTPNPGLAGQKVAGSAASPATRLAEAAFRGILRPTAIVNASSTDAGFMLPSSQSRVSRPDDSCVGEGPEGDGDAGQDGSCAPRQPVTRPRGAHQHTSGPVLLTGPT